jgi:nicotinamide-nucleotide amidase
MKAEIISIGRELLMGETVDTNASFIAKQLPLLGIELLWVSQVGDIQSQIVEVLRRALNRSDLIITTGGLGPTGDDLTRESIAELMGEKMTVIPELEKDLRERFRRMHMPEMPVSNLKQCTLIPSAVAIPNDQGTAPGWWVEKDGRVIVCMPGPPREMHEVWAKEILKRLRDRSGSVILAKTWKTFGYSEAAIGEMTFPLFSDDNPSLGVYAKPDGIQLQLKVTASTKEKARALLSAGEAKIIKVLGDSIWGIDDESLEMVVGRLLAQKGLTLSIIEDYSGGHLTSGFSDVPGSQTFFSGGIVALTDTAKIALGVPASTITRYGTVSSATADAMAVVAKERFHSDIGIGITGIADGPSQNGTVYVSINDGTSNERPVRPRDKQRLITKVLFELRKLLLVK